MIPNANHLQLFYHVARHRGISAALPHIPYGIQQPALSEQMLELERGLGVTLFTRRPFALTPAGERLYATVAAMHHDLPAVVAAVKGEAQRPRLRVGAGDHIQGRYLPGGLIELQRSFPEIQLQVRTGPTEELLDAVRAQEIDLAIVGVDQSPEGLAVLPLVEVPLVLLAPKERRTDSLPKLDRPGRIEEPLVTLGPKEGMSRLFERVLAERGVRWPSTLASASLALTPWFVANGKGVGVTLDLDVARSHPGLRIFPLAGFPPVRVVAAWLRPESKVLEAFLGIVSRVAVAWAAEAQARGSAAPGRRTKPGRAGAAAGRVRAQ